MLPELATLVGLTMSCEVDPIDGHVSVHRDSFSHSGTTDDEAIKQLRRHARRAIHIVCTEAPLHGTDALAAVPDGVRAESRRFINDGPRASTPCHGDRAGERAI
jgi:hypothetical protein